MMDEVQKYIDFIINKINSINKNFVNQDIRRKAISDIFEEISLKKITNIDEMKKIVNDYTINMLVAFLNNKLHSQNIINNLDFNSYNEDSKFFSNALLIANKVVMNLNVESLKYQNLRLPKLYGVDFNFEENGNVNFKFENNCNYIEYVKKFYYELFPNNIGTINDIFNNIRCIEGNGRAHFNGYNIIMYLDKGLNLDDLYALVHEIAHNLYFKFHRNSLKKDEELSEIESQYMEMLFSKYLLVNPIKCIDNAKVRNINLQDIERRQFSVMQISVVNNSFRVINEVNFLRNFNENGKKIDRQLLSKFANSTDINSMIESSFLINSIIGHYANSKEDLRCHNGEHLSNECRFLYSGILSLNFADILSNIKNVDKFLDYIKFDKDYKVKKFLELFNLSESDYLSLVTNFTNKYLYLKNKYVNELNLNGINYIPNYKSSMFNNLKMSLEKNKYEMIKIKQSAGNSNILGFIEQIDTNSIKK